MNDSGNNSSGNAQPYESADVPVNEDNLILESELSSTPKPPKKRRAAKQAPSSPRANSTDAKEVISYRYNDKRKNNPHVGMVDTASDGVESHSVWRYDPHIDPALQFDMGRAQIENLIDDALASKDAAVMTQALEQLRRMQASYLNWTGKAERTSFDVDLVSLHVHERIDPATILSALQKQIKNRKGQSVGPKAVQMSLFSAPFENLPLRDAIDFYKHDRDWANRLLAGDSLLVMNSLIQKESMAGKVQMIYIDPPYGIKYGSNFQPFVNKRDVKDRNDDDADAAVARSGETFRQGMWRDELLKTGIRGKGGQILKLADLESLPGCRYIHSVGIVADSGDRVAVSFGPEHAALEQRQVEIAMREAGELFPLPKMLVFCAFTFDPEAAKDIDNIKGIAAIKVHMNIDLMTDDLKKKRAGNESFWLMGQPDVELRALKDGGYQVEVHGFDYFDTKTGELVSGGKHNIAMWELDTDYDDRSLVARQVFFPMAGSGDGWHKLKKDIKAELDPDRLQQFHGTVSLPFEAGENRRIAVKIIDDRGIESLKVMDLM